jgi:hypothetical protein
MLGTRKCCIAKFAHIFFTPHVRSFCDGRAHLSLLSAQCIKFMGDLYGDVELLPVDNSSS